MEKKIDIKKLGKDFKKSPIGRGQTATCYLMKDGSIYKEFNGLLDYHMLHLEELVNHQNPNITFPKQLVYSNNELVGYIKDYAPGIEIDNLDDFIDIKKLKNAIKDLEENVYDTFFSLIFTDLSGENLVYDQNKNKVTIIDTDFFEPATTYDEKSNNKNMTINAFLENKVWLNQSFYSLFSEATNIKGRISNIAKESFSGLSSTSFALDRIINELEQKTNSQINTIGEYKQAIEEVKEQINGEDCNRHR